MTAQCRPAEPRFTTTSEREVWQRLRDQLPPEAVLVANLRITDARRDSECDLLVLWPEVGIVVLEVKGGHVAYDGERWTRTTSHGTTRVAPVAQLLETKYAVREFVEADPRWPGGHVAWSHGLVAPYSAFGPDFATPDCPRWMVHGREDQALLAERVRDNAVRGGQGRVAPSAEEVALLVEVLRGRGYAAPSDRNAAADARRAELDRLTEEQATLLRVTRLIPRVEVRGGAGSGKTVLALTQAKQLSAGREDQPAQRVAMLCYSIGLAEYFKRVVSQWPRRQRPAFVGTYEELGRSWGAPSGTREDSDFWENQLPDRMAELASQLPAGQRFDCFVVDEAQDFAESWWTALLRAMKDDETGGLYCYSDENQRIFARYGRPPVPLVPLVLDHNLRNTRQVYEAFRPLGPTRMVARGGDGPEVGFLEVGAGADPFERADEAVELLLDLGWDPGNVALLATGSRHPAQLSEIERLGQQGYMRTYWDADDVFYGHVLGCKGLERPAVVLLVNDEADHPRVREKLYVGMSRATDQLVVVGDRGVVREIGGEQVAAALGLR